MVPTFQDGQYLIVDEISYHLHDPQRGDVVIFKYPKDPSKYFIKRVMGLPGETVEVKGSDVIIYNTENPDGLKLSQPFVENTSNNNMRTELGEGEYFVMGDNRRESSDSRYWGAVPRDMMIGRALVRLFPIAQASYLPGDFKN
jgi:signal peptidase I